VNDSSAHEGYFVNKQRSSVSSENVDNLITLKVHHNKHIPTQLHPLLIRNSSALRGQTNRHRDRHW